MGNEEPLMIKMMKNLNLTDIQVKAITSRTRNEIKKSSEDVWETIAKTLAHYHNSYWKEQKRMIERGMYRQKDIQTLKDKRFAIAAVVNDLLNIPEFDRQIAIPKEHGLIKIKVTKK